MTRNEARLLHVSTALLGGTGIVYGWMRYFCEPDPDSFSILNHPWQPHFQHAHIVLAPLLVFACGMIWRQHVWARVKSGFRTRRMTGLVLFGFVIPMIVSGYGVQVSVDELWRAIWIWTHGLTSVAWLGGYAVHQFSSRSEKARASSESTG